MYIHKIFILVFFCLTQSIVCYSQVNIDSLQNVLNQIDKNNADYIAKIGNLIIKNTDSDLVKYNTLGYIIHAYSFKNEKQKVLPYLNQAKDIAEQMENPVFKAKAYLTVSSLYTSIGLTQQSHVYLQKSIFLAEKVPKPHRDELKAFVFMEAANLSYSEKKIDSANFYYQKSLSQISLLENFETNKELKYFYKYSLYGYGKTLLKLNKTDSSEFYLNKSLSYFSELDPDLDFHIKEVLATVYTENKQYSRAIDSLQNILNDKNFNLPELKADIYLGLTKNYKTIGENEKYIEYNEKYLELNTKLNQKNISVINNVFEEEGDKKEEKKTLNLYVLSAILIAILFVILIFLKRKKTKKEKLPHAPEKIVLSSEVEKNILEGLNEFEKSNAFTNNKLNISTLANQLDTNTTYLSEVIRRNKNKNFSNYINELRIKFICNELENKPEYLNYKISYLAEVSGFNSHSFFATVFKNITGISPSDYIESKGNKNQQLN